MKKLINISSLSVVASAIVLSLIFTGCGDDPQNDNNITDQNNEGNHNPYVNILQNDKTINVGTTVNLESKASDIDGDDLTYEWKFVSKPTGSSATLTTTTTKKASFTADKAGKYVVQFVAKDIVDAVGKDTVTITAIEAGAISNTCTSPTEISGTYTTDKTLDGCFKVVSSISVSNNSLLTINPGSTLMFAQGTYLEITSDSALKAIGTISKPIIFAGATKASGQWQGIQFRNSVDSRNELEYVIIEHGGSWHGALYADGHTKLKVRNSIIRNNSGYGFYFGDDVSLSEFTNVTSTKNEKTAGRIGVNVLPAMDSSSNFRGNLGSDYLTVASGTLKGNQTWNALSVPALISSITVPKNKLLTIKPGASFDFESGSYIEIKGGMKAIGTPEKEDKTTGKITPAKLISFSGATKASGQWQGIQFRNSVDSRNELEYVVIEYGGSWHGALYADGHTKLKVRNSIIKNNNGYGFYFGDDVSLSEFTNVTSTKNEKTAGRIGVNALSAMNNSSDFTGNIGSDHLTVASGTLNGNQTWNPLNVPALISSISVPKNKTLTINPDAIFDFESGSYLEVKGTLKAIGTPTKPITFTGATKSAGFWQGVQFRNAVSSDNELSNVVIEYGGSWHSSLYADGFTVLKINNSKITNSSTFGMWLGQDTTITQSNITFADNNSGNVHQN